MKYDFTSIIDRQGQDAMAVDGLGMYPGMSPSKPKGGFDFIPMWVADMNFPTVPTIPEAIIERAKHPAYGYFAPRDTYFDEIIKWHQKRNGVNGLKKEYIGYENGVLGGILSALQCLAAPGDAVLLHSPTYIGFTASLKNNGYKMIHSELKKAAGAFTGWIMRIWKRRSGSTISMLRLCVHLIIRRAVSGNSGSWKRRWRYMNNML